MKTTARSIFSATIALGLIAFTFIAACSPGASSSVTLTAFGLLVIYGLVEMALVSYAPRRAIQRPASVRVVVPQNENVMVRVPAMVECPSCSTCARAA